MEKEFRRKAPRRNFDGYAGVLFQGTVEISRCLQIGEGGALIRTNSHTESITQGDFLVLTLFLPNIGGVVATAECVYHAKEPKKIGLQFTHLDTTYKKKVREFVSRRKTQEVQP